MKIRLPFLAPLVVCCLVAAGCGTGGSSSLGDTADDAYAAGQRAEAAGDLEGAARAYEKAVERNPQFVPVRLSLAYLYYRMDRGEDALEAALVTAELSPRLAGAHELVAELSVRFADYERALNSARTALEIEPTRLGAQLQLARAYEGLDRLEDAVATYNALLKLEPAHRDGRLAYAELLTRLGRPRRAIDQLGIAVKLHPDDLEPRLRLARAYLEATAYDQVVELLANDASDDAEAHLLLGRAYLMRGQDPLAVIELQKAVDLSPDKAGAYVALGEAEFRRGYMDRARDYVKKALERDPDEVDAYLLEARVKERAGDEAGAEQSLRAAVAAVPDAWAPARELARRLEKSGRTADAAAMLAPFTTGTWTRKDASLYLATLTSKGVPAGGAIDALERLHKTVPDDYEVLEALVSLAIGHPGQGSVPPATLVDRAADLREDPDGDPTQRLIWHALALARAGSVEPARDMLRAAADRQQDPRIAEALQSLR